MCKRKIIKDKIKEYCFVINMMIKCTKLKILNDKICEMLKIGWNNLLKKMKGKICKIMKVE